MQIAIGKRQPEKRASQAQWFCASASRQSEPASRFQIRWKLEDGRSLIVSMSEREAEQLQGQLTSLLSRHQQQEKSGGSNVTGA